MNTHSFIKAKNPLSSLNIEKAEKPFTARYKPYLTIKIRIFDVSGLKYADDNKFPRPRSTDE